MVLDLLWERKHDPTGFFPQQRQVSSSLGHTCLPPPPSAVRCTRNLARGTEDPITSSLKHSRHGQGPGRSTNARRAPRAPGLPSPALGTAPCAPACQRDRGHRPLPATRGPPNLWRSCPQLTGSAPLHPYVTGNSSALFRSVPTGWVHEPFQADFV